MEHIPSKHGPRRPARPADAIRQLAVPQAAPPYDDEASTNPEGNGECPAAAPWLPRGPHGHEQDLGQPVSPHSAEQGADLRDPGNQGGRLGAWPGQFAQILAETLAGARPQRQLTPWTTEEVRRHLRQLGPLFGTGDRPMVRRIMTAAPASGVLEVTAVVDSGSRVRVLALRLERDRTGRGWCCTAIESA